MISLDETGIHVIICTQKANGIGPYVNRSKRPLFACLIYWKVSIETSRNSLDRSNSIVRSSSPTRSLVIVMYY